MAKCAECGESVSLPYLCRRCNRYYCARHRLPESHHCAGLHESKEESTKKTDGTFPIVVLPRESRGSTIRRDIDEKAVHNEPGYYQFSYGQPYGAESNRRSFSRVEVKHLLIATCLLTLVSFSLVDPFFLMEIPTSFDFAGFLVLTAILIISFLPHELMHKRVAQRYGLFAEFRIVPSYAMLTLLTAILPLFKIFAPGAVMIAGEASPEAYGKTAAAGPAYNIAIGAIMFTLIFLLPGFTFFLVLGVFLCGWFALFNLFPIPPLDGEKVLRWSRTVFLILLAGAIPLFVYGTITWFT